MAHSTNSRSVAKGYEKPTYICFDCSKPTKAVTRVYRGRIETLVCRNGSGCHKSTPARSTYA